MMKNNTIQWVLFPTRGLKEFGRNLGKFQYTNEFNKSSNSVKLDSWVQPGLVSQSQTSKDSPDSEKQSSRPSIGLTSPWVSLWV